MAMQWWLYKGSVTTPVDIPGQGPTIIRPRMKFQAPPRVVANLKRAGLVVPCADPTPKKKEESAALAKPVAAVPKSEQSKSQAAQTSSKWGTDEVAPVVASTPSSLESKSVSSEKKPVDGAGSIGEVGEVEDEG